MSLETLISTPCTVTGAPVETVEAGGGSATAAGPVQQATCKQRPVVDTERTIDDRTVTELFVHVLPATLTITSASVFSVNGHDYQVIGEPWLAGNDDLGHYWVFHASGVLNV